jgi:diguanylate cyclase (GGDEF)-like protein
MESLANLSQSAQIVGVMLIATLLWPVVRVIRERYLDYWAIAWFLLSVGLISLYISLNSSIVVPLRILYCISSYGFGFLLWAGSRTYATGRPLRRFDYLWLLPPMVYGILAPIFAPNGSQLFGWHAGLMAIFFCAALWETRRFHPRNQSAVGLRLYQGALFGLILLFAHYSALLLYYRVWLASDFRFPHMSYSSLYDLVMEALLAFGMVTIATERMRAELIEANKKLEAAATELQKTACTDPLTGLLNRRGLDDLLSHPEQIRAGCLVMIDVTDLKVLNDQHGHEIGDVALRLLARALRNQFRVTDPIFRLGGDEFLVLMPAGSTEELVRRMLSLDQSLRGHRLSGQHSPIDVHVAWGIASYTSTETLTQAMTTADESMYIQKKIRKGSSPR